MIQLTFMLFSGLVHAEHEPYALLMSKSRFNHRRSLKNDEIKINFHTRTREDLLLLQSTMTQAQSMLKDYFDFDDRCRDLEINVYELPTELINDRKLMHFLAWSKWENKNILGAYDGSTSLTGTASIFLTRDKGIDKLLVTAVHEMSHHWQYIHCKELNEKQARDFEGFYLEHI